MRVFFQELIGDSDPEIAALSQKCERVKKLTDFYLSKVPEELVSWKVGCRWLNSVFLFGFENGDVLSRKKTVKTFWTQNFNSNMITNWMTDLKREHCV